ncbi:MAG: PSD1 domain-containing protein [Planctomycetaceae bacterium]|nr:PSD1 domain-containing protein [Planctomycetaceae bacterium]
MTVATFILAGLLNAGRADELEFFEKEVRPLLVERCFQCHSGDEREGGLRLDSRFLILKGGESGPAVQSDQPETSLLLKAIEYLDEPKMPPDGKLADAEIDTLRRWIMQGAPWPSTDDVDAAPQAADSAWTPTDKQRSWWAFKPVHQLALPSVQNRSWPQNGIDQFILAGLEEHGLSPAAPARSATWLRRVTFDLTGLPPTPEEIDAFVPEDSPALRVQTVERLLAAPTYGQRWGRHWLDIVRYADYHDGDAKARDANCEPMNAWRYRDWVVDSFNRDLPFDQFIVHQIAGDLLPDPAGGEFYADGLVATTFLSNGVWDRGDADKEKMLSDMVDDNVDTIGKAFMGLTLGCARCHDHKFDPISQQDYYGLAGIFYSTHVLKDLGGKGANYFLNRVPMAERSFVEQRDSQVQQIADCNTKIKALDDKNPRSPEEDTERTALIQQRDTLQASLPAEPPYAEAAVEGGTPGSLFPGIQDVPVHIRGSYTRLGTVVPRHMPVFLSAESQPPISHGSGRRELAAWVASSENPLTARVIVNRVWQWHFGAGLVRTPNNFGLLSEPPSHPELLDWLASRFVAEGWSIKSLHRMIVLSATYAQSAEATPDKLQQDPENRYLARFLPRRLEAEAIRDAMLSVTGRLDTAAGGPAGDDLNSTRRSLYVQTARWDRGSFAMLFDAANMDASDEKRTISTVAPQALFLLNHPFTMDRARDLAARLQKDAPGVGSDIDAARLQRAYNLLFGRSPTQKESEIGLAIVESDATTGWTDLAHILLATNEFVYVE